MIRDLFRQFLFPTVLTLLGLLILISGLVTGQGSMFLFGGIAIIGAGIFSFVSIIAPGTPVLRFSVLGVFLIISVILGASSYNTVMKEIKFQDEWEIRKAHIVQRLIDIRTSQMAYKNVNGQFTPSFDSLLAFVEQDSFLVIRAIGTVPDTLSEQEAVEMGLVERDTSYFAVADSIFGARAMKDRKIYFNLDSLPYVPFSGQKFEMDASVLDRGNQKIPVFEAKDPKSFNPDKELQVGSITEPNTNGNWE